MRKKLLISVSMLLCVVMLSFANVSPKTAYNEVTPKTENEVLNVANNATVSDKVLEARFLNMLNHNFVYNDDFRSDEIMVNNSVLALLNLAEGSYIAESHVKDYIFNMYGIIMNDFSTVNTEFDGKDDYLYIIPRGYALYEHKINQVTANSDGSYTVVTDVVISYEDGTYESCKATTLFLANNESQFGYNILYSDIEAALAVTGDC